ncbi:MAG: ABC transporter permease [Bauldia sp.]|nr:ABC transporter permease [Bauldia sp.]
MLIERSDTSDPARRPVASFRTRPAIAVLLLAFCVALTVLGEYLAPGFASTSNILQLLKIASFLGLVAMGQTVVMLVGGIDLSVAWVLTGAAVVFTNTSAGSDANAILAVSAALLVGVAAGFVNGFGVVKLSISPIVMTLAMNNIMLGVTLVYTGGSPRGSPSPFVRSIATGSFEGIPWMLVLWALLSFAVIMVTRYSRWGRRLLAVGENARVSHLSGIDNDRIKISAYVFSGTMAALAGIVFSAFSGASFLGMGDQFLLPTIAAVVLGGTSMFGGRGGYGGTIAAVMFTTLLSTILVIGNISAGVRNIIFGSAIIAAIVIQRLLSRGNDAT